MDLNTILIILGVVALIALIVHGLWANRREKSKYFQNSELFNRTSVSPKTEHNVSSDMSTNSPVAPSIEQPMSAPLENTPPPMPEAVNPDHEDARHSEKSVDDIKISIPDIPTPSSPIRPVYQMHSEPSNERNIATISISALEAQSDDEEGISAASHEIREQLEQMSRGEFAREEVSPDSDDTKPKSSSGFILLYIVSAEKREFQGHRLSQVLENLGFICGDDKMYHRHLDLNAASPVLFTVANIEQPGTFDIYQMATFSTIGLTLFMPIPSVGSDLANLRTMLATAKNLAKDLNGFILTDQQEIFDEQAEQAYLSRVA